MTSKKRPQSRRGKRWTFSPLYILIPAFVLILAGGIWLMTHPGVPSSVSKEPGFPEFVRTAAPRVQQAYAQAVKYHSEFERLACYCGCGPDHRSLRDCFISEVGVDGRISYSRHAAT